VIVNRVWGWHFGQPLVRTPSNFGKLGTPPTHPELLDDLTARFIASGWSLKALHREIVLSATYRQSSQISDCGLRIADSSSNPQSAIRNPKSSDPQSIDPDNLWLWRMNRRRLDVEAWRDAMLRVAGRLKTDVGGPSANLDDPAMTRRTLYGQVSRKQPAPLLRLFDVPEATRHAEQRSTTTTAVQQLFYLNSPFVRAQAAAVVEAVAPEDCGDDPAIRSVFRRVLGRDPSDRETALARGLLDRGEGLEPRERWVMLAQALLASNEFLFVD
jgi:hypothetical protein